jgi:hypothetical protein
LPVIGRQVTFTSPSPGPPVGRVVHLIAYPPDLGGNGAEHRLMHARNT